MASGASTVPSTSPASASTRATQQAGARAVYRTLDLLIATVGLLCLGWLLAAACVLIRLESGAPAIFRQRRLGLGKRPFTVHKLRTMRLGANPEVHRRYIAELISQAPRATGPRALYKLTADERVTRVGRVLRRTSIDELPQLFDVLRGHMSVVGPRPVTAYEAELYPLDYERRFAVKPGLTGLWQVNGRNECTYHEMLALDLAWVERRTPLLYLAIVLRTPWILARGRGAA
jgi:lipopolysaccharide/colanic/teichoic acid biosynthesis glycosyltransferase